MFCWKPDTCLGDFALWASTIVLRLVNVHVFSAANEQDTLKAPRLADFPSLYEHY